MLNIYNKKHLIQRGETVEAQKFNEFIKRIRFDKVAYAEIYRYYFPRAVIYLTKIFKDYYLAEDAAQEFFFDKLFRINIPDYIDSPLSWIFTSCRNLALNFRDREISTIELRDEVIGATLKEGGFDEGLLSKRNETEDYFEALLAAGLSESIVEKFRKMDRDIVEIYILYYWEGLSQKEISEKLNLNYNTVKSKVKRWKKYSLVFFLKCNFLLGL